ncbi:MAG: hypothetical protein WAW37_01995 [Syntrophobacteraceae bacterium]
MPRCPKCNSPLHRIHRRPFDKFICNWVPYCRYACSKDSCGWVGNLRDWDEPVSYKAILISIFSFLILTASVVAVIFTK